MSRSIAAIQQDIQALSIAEKLEILATLMDELDDPADVSVKAAWLEEAGRRAAEIDSDTVKCIPADEVLARLDAKLRP